MCLCWVKDGLLSAAFSFLASARGITELSSDTTMLLGFALTMGGFGGGAVANATAERCFGGRRAPALVLFTALQLGSILLFWATAVHGQGDLVICLFFFLSCMFMLGNYSTLTFLVPASLPKSVVAQASGLMVLTGYVASGCSGMYIGYISSHTTDETFVSWLLSLCVATGGTLLFAAVAALESYKGLNLRLPPIWRKVNSTAVSPDLQFLLPSMFFADTTEITEVRLAGIADELLRTRMSMESDTQEATFHQWPARGSARDRLEWRAYAAPTTDTRAFLDHRRDDPTSYFGQGSVNMTPSGGAIRIRDPASSSENRARQNSINVVRPGYETGVLVRQRDKERKEGR
jgi:hypothetical protein